MPLSVQMGLLENRKYGLASQQGLPAKVLLKVCKDMDSKTKNKHNREINVNLY